MGAFFLISMVKTAVATRLVLVAIVVRVMVVVMAIKKLVVVGYNDGNSSDDGSRG